jgi:hypothetical protein
VLIRIPFAELRPVGASPARPDPGDIDALLFVVDTVNAVPGSSGSVWVGEIRVEEYVSGAQVLTVSSR